MKRAKVKAEANATLCPEKGITLVALVITIIVLIILAAVSINAVMNGGIIQNAKDARDEFDKAKISEEQMLKATEMQMHELAGTYPTETDSKYFIIENGVLKGFNSEGAPSDIVIPQGVTSIEADGYEESGEPKGVFKECQTITSVVIPGTVKRIGMLGFAGCENLKNVYMYEGVEEIGQIAFNSCSSLESIVLPSTVNDIGIAAFANCENLSNVILKDGIEGIGDTMFAGCKSLKNVTLSNTLTGIGGSTFDGCVSLENIVIPASVEGIGGWNFHDCTNLKTIEFKGTTAPFFYENSNFQSAPLEKVYIPQGTTAAYTQALGESKCGLNNDILVSSLLEER